MTMTTSVLVLGSNFAGLTAALALKHELGEAVDVTVASTSRRFLFTPSLIWVPFGKRTIKKISFPVDETLDQHGVHFVHQAATRIDPDGKRVTLADGATRSYDYLVIATGYRNDLDRVPGIGMGQNASRSPRPPRRRARASSGRASSTTRETSSSGPLPEPGASVRRTSSSSTPPTSSRRRGWRRTCG